MFFLVEEVVRFNGFPNGYNKLEMCLKGGPNPSVERVDGPYPTVIKNRLKKMYERLIKETLKPRISFIKALWILYYEIEGRCINFTFI